MKYYLVALIALLMPSQAFAVIKSQQEAQGNAPQGVIVYDRTCDATGMPDGLPKVTAISGGGTVITTTYTCGTSSTNGGCPSQKVWVQTSTRTGTTPDFTFTDTCKTIQ